MMIARAAADKGAAHSEEVASPYGSRR